MRLVAFSVKNFRSIRSTPRIGLADLTVLVGPNNEGKSNLLSALVCALSLAQERTAWIRRVSIGRSHVYDYERDYPVELQSVEGAASTKFELEFELDPDDGAAFRAAVGSKLNGTLPISISVAKDGGTTFTVQKQGPAQRSLNDKRREIAQFLSERLQFQYIEAVRDETKSRFIVESMVSRALARLEADPAYQAALRAIEDAERPVLEEVSRIVQSSLMPFIGSLRRVSMQVGREQRARAMRRSAEILLDDGTLTPLAQKGDGVKSLVAIALAKASAEGSAGSRNLILAIEEPEAHLHSGAVHVLKSLLEDIAQQRQVIISTHEPALVRRDDVSANIIVRGNKAKPAKSLEEVRQVLGVQLAENLVSPDLVVLVEGPGDERLLAARVRAVEPMLYKAMASGRLRIQALNGAGNLPHQLRFYQALVCSAIAFVDDDAEGNAALAKARRDGLLDTGAEFCTSKPGAGESELEDLLDPALYTDDLCRMLGLSTMKSRKKDASKKKWSARLELALSEHGKPKADHERLLREAKFRVSELAVAGAKNCFIPALASPVDALFSAVKASLGIPRDSLTETP